MKHPEAGASYQPHDIPEANILPLVCPVDGDIARVFAGGVRAMGGADGWQRVFDDPVRRGGR